MPLRSGPDVDPSDPRRIRELDPKAELGAYQLDTVADRIFQKAEKALPIGDPGGDPSEAARRLIFVRAARWWAFRAAMRAASSAQHLHVDRPTGEHQAAIVDEALSRIEAESAKVLASDPEAMATVRARIECDDAGDEDDWGNALEEKETEYVQIIATLKVLLRQIHVLNRPSEPVVWKAERGDILRREFFSVMTDCWRALMYEEPPHSRSGPFVRLVHAAWTGTNMPPIRGGNGRAAQSPDAQIRIIGTQLHEHFKQKPAV